MKSGNTSPTFMGGFEQFLKENPGQEFRPFAFYDKHLDCIRVQTRDCSFKEIRLDKIFTVLQANHTTGIEYVGFTIKGVRHLTERLGLPKTGPVMLAAIIDAIIKQNPDVYADFIQANFGHLLEAEIAVDDFDLAA